MIIDLIFLIAGAILKAISMAFGLIPFDQVTTYLSQAIAWMFAPISYFGDIIDIPFFATILRNLILFEIAWLTYKIILAMMNWIKLKGHHPS